MYPFRRLRPLVIVFLATLGAGAGAADMTEERDSAAARYEVERAMCLRGESPQDRTTCLRESGAAYEQAWRIRPKDDSSQLVANRFLRCDRLPDEQRHDCVARMEGQGTINGSVAGGGIYRELVTIVEEGDGARND
jgi:hypothetical protein